MSLSKRQEDLKQKLLNDGAIAASLLPAAPERKPFDALIESIHTRDLLLILNRCLVSEPLTQPLRQLFIYILAILPLRPNGVRDVFEFVVAVHPSTRGLENPSSHEHKNVRRGPSITPDALQAATRLISSPPSFMSPGDWFNGIAPQLLFLLDSVEERELAHVAAYMIGKILGPEKYGKPGREGWTAFALPILENIAPPRTLSVGFASKTKIEYANLSRALRRLETLTNSHPNPGLTIRLLRPVRLQLWAIASYFCSLPNTDLEEICLTPARRLLQTYLRLERGEQSFVSLQRIANNLMFKGQDWNYVLDDNGCLNIVKSQDIPTLEIPSRADINLKPIDHAVSFFITLLRDTGDIRGIPDLFLGLLRKWLKNSQTISSVRLNRSFDSWESKYIETKLVQEMLEKLPEKIISDSTQILRFIMEFLDTFVKSRSKENIDGEALGQASLLLSLLHTVLSSPGVRTPSFQSANSDILSKIEPLLEKITNHESISEEDSDLSEISRNLLQFLLWRDHPNNTEPEEKVPQDIYTDDLKKRDLAISYLTSLDSPPPVRAEGLHLLSSLIESKSIVLDVNTTIHLFCSLLQAEEEYIYLHTIKSIVTLSTHHPRTVITTLLDKYIDTDELLALDPRLRLGEALAQTISAQASHHNFRGPYIQTLGTALLHIASLRPTKPKAAAARAKTERLQAAKDREAAAAWGGTVPDLDDALVPQHEQADAAILTQILAGWTGKRDAEDLRIRSSALAILAAAVRANSAAFPPALLAEAVDLSLLILKLEGSDAAAILRRAAILFIGDLVHALDAGARAAPTCTLGAGGVEAIRDVLGYVATTDADGLVRRHATDVRECLANWRDGALLRMLSASEETLGQGLGGALRGLAIDPAGADRRESGRVKGLLIEEVE